MVKTQIQLPEELYGIAKAIAKQRQWSLAEVIRRGVEYMSIVYPLSPNASDWKLPVLKGDAFKSDFDQLDFRAIAEADEVRAMPMVHEKPPSLKTKTRSQRQKPKGKR
jgi:hypothetical protein